MIPELAAKALTPRILPRVVVAVDPQRPPEEFRPLRLLVFIGGGRASGKTALKHHVLSKFAQEGVPAQYVAKFGSDIFSDVLEHPVVIKFRNNFDSRARDVASGSGGIASQIVREVFRNARNTAYAQGSPLLLDYHMDNPALVREVLAEAKAHGYETMFVAPHISAEKMLERLEQRKQHTGRGYNLETALQTHKGFAEHLPEYLRSFDAGILMDNNADFAPPSPIAVSHRGHVTVFNGEAYGEARRKAHLNVGARIPADFYPAIAANSQRDLLAHPERVGDSAPEGPAGGADASRNATFAKRLAESLIESTEVTRRTR